MTGAVDTAGLAPDALAGQVAVVTGAGQGIGREVARTLAAVGARVIVVAAAPDGAGTERAIVEAGGQALFIQADVSDEASVAALAATAESAFGPVDLLIYSAVHAHAGALLDTAPADWDQAFAAGLRGAFLTCRGFGPGMRSRARGTIVIMSSADARPGLAARNAAAHGLIGLSQSLAAEVGQQGVRVVAFDPGTPTPAGDEPANALTTAHAAAAAAYLVAKLAGDYHGRVVNSRTVLERAGVLDGQPRPAATGAGRYTHINRALTLSQQLHSILVQSEAEFDKLPIFVRPMARGGFKSRTGQRIQDWVRALAKLNEQMQRMQATHASADAEFLVDYPRMIEWLNRLVDYFEAVPGETALQAPDAVQQKVLSELVAYRVTTIHALTAALTAIHETRQ